MSMLANPNSQLKRSKNKARLPNPKLYINSQRPNITRSGSPCETPPRHGYLHHTLQNLSYNTYPTLFYDMTLSTWHYLLPILFRMLFYYPPLSNALVFWSRGDHWAKIVEQRAIKNRVQYIHCR
jgi:hypothetical protein